MDLDLPRTGAAAVAQAREVSREVTEALLVVGVITTGTFCGVVAIEGARRPGYDPAYHTASELEIGDRGWIMRAAFVTMGAGMAAYAVGVHDALDAITGPVLLGVFALGNLASGAFIPDPVRGFPSGPPIQAPPRTPTRHAQIHDAAGPVMFLALLGACVAVATRLDGWWVVYSVVTAITGFGLIVWTAWAYQRDAARTGLVQRCLLGTFYLWIMVIGIHLAV